MAKSKDTLTSLRKRVSVLEGDVEFLQKLSNSRLVMLERAEREKVVFIKTIEQLAEIDT